MKVINRFVFTEQNLKELKSTGKRVDMFYDAGCKGLAVRLTSLRQEPMYVVVVNYANGATQKNIGGVGRVALQRAREIATNIMEHKEEFLDMDFTRGEGLAVDFEKRGFLPRLNRELPFNKPRPAGNIPTYDGLENYRLRKLLGSIIDDLKDVSDSLDKVIQAIKDGE